MMKAYSTNPDIVRTSLQVIRALAIYSPASKARLLTAGIRELLEAIHANEAFDDDLQAAAVVAFH